MRVVGIDPGLKGALALVDTDTGAVLGIEDMPTAIFVDDRPVPDPIAIARILTDWQPDLIILEHVEARPASGRTSEWRFAQGFGALMAACQLVTEQPSTHLVRPKKWKHALGLSADKSLSLDAARDAFPDAAEMLTRAKDDGRAEALMLIEYYRRELLSAPEMEVI